MAHCNGHADPKVAGAKKKVNLVLCKDGLHSAPDLLADHEAAPLPSQMELAPAQSHARAMLAMAVLWIYFRYTFRNSNSIKC